MPRVVRIPGLKEPLTFPTGTPTEDIYAAIADRLFPVEEAPPIPKEAPSFFQAFGEGATTLGNVPEALRYLYEPSGATRKEAAATTESPYEFQQVSDIGGVGDVGRFIKEQAGQAAGFIAAPVAAAKAASAATPASLPFVGRAAKPIAAATAFLGTAGAQYLSNTAGRQAAEQEKRVKEGQAPEMPEVTKMLLTSAGQAGLDYAGFRLFKPLGELIGLSGKEMIKQRADDILETAIEEGAEAAAKKLIGKQSVLKGAAYGAAVEAAQEPIQQLLERYGAGLALDSDEAIKEYFESAIAGGLLGGPIGGVSTVMSNYQNDAYSKDTLKNLSDAIRGGKDPKTEWKEAQKAILAEAKPISILDEKGNVITITPEFLSTLGVNPSAKSIMGTPIENIIGQSAADPGVMVVFQKFFDSKLKEINEKIQRKDITDEERADLVTLHSQLATGLKTFKDLGTKARTEKSNATKAANKAKAAEEAAATAGVTPEVKPTPDDALAVLESDIEKSFGDDAGRVFDLADELMSKGVVTDRAAALAQATKEVAQQKAADVQAGAEAETAVVPEPTETVKESADKIAEQEATKAEETVTPQPEVGFKTAQGSLYSVDKQGKTARTKLSEGKGKGTTYEPHPVLYVNPKDAQSILGDMQSGSMNKAAGKKSNSVKLGYVLNNTFKPVTEVSQIPEGANAVVAVIDNNTNQAVGVYPAKLDPEVGLSPIEKLYNPDGTANTHVGNQIVEIFGKPTGARPTPKVAPEAGERSEAYTAVKAMKEKIDDLMRQSSEAQDEIMSIGRTKRGSSNDKRKQELLEKRNTLDRETGDLLFKFDKAKDEYIKNNPEEVARIQAEKAAAAPAPEVTAEPTPEVTPEAADADTRIRYYLGNDFASAIASRPAQEQVALTKQVTETLDQIDKLEKNRTALRAQNDQPSVDAVTKQILKLENSLDDLQYSLTDVPNTREKVQEAIKANGNATEANKISTDIRKDMCD